MATAKKKQTKKKSSSRRVTKPSARPAVKKKNPLYQDIAILVTLAVSILLFISNFGVGGLIGNGISSFFFGVFGIMAFCFPVILFFGIAFYISNKDSVLIERKMAGAAGALFFLCGFFQVLMIENSSGNQLVQSFVQCSREKIGGGVIGALQSWILKTAFGTVGAYVIITVGLIISVIVMTQRPVISALRSRGEEAYKSAYETRKEKKSDRLERHSKKVRQTTEGESRQPVDIILKKTDFTEKPEKAPRLERLSGLLDEEIAPFLDPEEAYIPEERTQKKQSKKKKDSREETPPIEIPKKAKDSSYEFPPLSLLKKPGRNVNQNQSQQFKATAMKLQQTLENFGVNVTITNISSGPSVTRYELQPEQGVKVSRIVNLSDDIKLNLAAADIRIEAPIPGKAAVGIEVPNKTNNAVLLRELLESEVFQNFPSDIAFAVGKDIAGQPVVSDIAKMPHLLIAGATGSGKSVCINTLIMSIIYKASPDDVKLIMIDPKVVELSVYNGIPHLYIPVVTDPKKAAGALNWAVAEMTDRYNKFADQGVRDLVGYNEKMKHTFSGAEGEKPATLPRIVIIVDELADLMMVAPGDVEDAICRLAQLARAAGIHLIIATQRPSVNVITGLIKANMPSRIAFSVSSGVDSRTILDMNGAEKLLGKGDMLFYPQGYQKPARVQGSFVSDQEVADVVAFLTKTHGESVYDAEIEEKINNHSADAAQSAPNAPSNERDAYFEQAGRFIIEKDKGSIGMLQRMFKIGFNRAARIMDQLSEAGVVGPEEGTKPRKILMSLEEFEKYIEK